jgi:hypothetical protein
MAIAKSVAIFFEGACKKPSPATHPDDVQKRRAVQKIIDRAPVVSTLGIPTTGLARSFS